MSALEEAAARIQAVWRGVLLREWLREWLPLEVHRRRTAPRQPAAAPRPADALQTGAGLYCWAAVASPQLHSFWPYRERIPETLTIQVLLPGVRSIAECDVSSTQDCLRVWRKADAEEADPAAALCDVPWQWPVDAQSAKAKFSKKHSRLTVTCDVLLRDDDAELDAVLGAEWQGTPGEGLRVSGTRVGLDGMYACDTPEEYVRFDGATVYRMEGRWAATDAAREAVLMVQIGEMTGGAAAPWEVSNWAEQVGEEYVRAAEARVERWAPTTSSEMEEAAAAACSAAEAEAAAAAEAGAAVRGGSDCGLSAAATAEDCLSGSGSGSDGGYSDDFDAARHTPQAAGPRGGLRARPQSAARRRPSAAERQLLLQQQQQQQQQRQQRHSSARSKQERKESGKDKHKKKERKEKRPASREDSQESRRAGSPERLRPTTPPAGPRQSPRVTSGGDLSADRARPTSCSRSRQSEVTDWRDEDDAESDAPPEADPPPAAGTGQERKSKKTKKKGKKKKELAEDAAAGSATPRTTPAGDSAAAEDAGDYSDDFAPGSGQEGGDYSDDFDGAGSGGDPGGGAKRGKKRKEKKQKRPSEGEGEGVTPSPAGSPGAAGRKARKSKAKAARGEGAEETGEAEAAAPEGSVKGKKSKKAKKRDKSGVEPAALGDAGDEPAAALIAAASAAAAHEAAAAAERAAAAGAAGAARGALAAAEQQGRADAEESESSERDELAAQLLRALEGAALSQREAAEDAEQLARGELAAAEEGDRAAAAVLRQEDGGRRALASDEEAGRRSALVSQVAALGTARALAIVRAERQLAGALFLQRCARGWAARAAAARSQSWWRTLQRVELAEAAGREGAARSAALAFCFGPALCALCGQLRAAAAAGEAAVRGGIAAAEGLERAAAAEAEAAHLVSARAREAERVARRRAAVTELELAEGEGREDLEDEEEVRLDELRAAAGGSWRRIERARLREAAAAHAAARQRAADHEGGARLGLTAAEGAGRAALAEAARKGLQLAQERTRNRELSEGLIAQEEAARLVGLNSELAVAEVLSSRSAQLRAQADAERRARAREGVCRRERAARRELQDEAAEERVGLTDLMAEATCEVHERRWRRARAREGQRLRAAPFRAPPSPRRGAGARAVRPSSAPLGGRAARHGAPHLVHLDAGLPPAPLGLASGWEPMPEAGSVPPAHPNSGTAAQGAARRALEAIRSASRDPLVNGVGGCGLAVGDLDSVWYLLQQRQMRGHAAATTAKQQRRADRQRRRRTMPGAATPPPPPPPEEAPPPPLPRCVAASYGQKPAGQRRRQTAPGPRVSLGRPSPWGSKAAAASRLSERVAEGYFTELALRCGLDRADRDPEMGACW